MTTVQRCWLLAASLAGMIAFSVPLRAQTPNHEPGSQASNPVSLVVLIAVDQLRPDYFQRFGHQFSGGLGRLYRNGTVYLDGRQDHAITQTGPGHSTMLSGRVPAHTGIASNGLGVRDPSAPIIGAPDAPGASPWRFRGTGLYDWMVVEDSATRVLSVSRKDRGAILPVGRAAGQVYWYADGLFTTSRYYRDTLPSWVQAYNARRGPAHLAGSVWRLLLPDTAYAEPDSLPFENDGRDYTFPHRLPADADSMLDEMLSYPWMDSLTLDFALEGVERMQLGQQGRPELLVVSLSTTDEIGHVFGPQSREVHDHLLRMDRWLGWFLDSLATMVPPDRMLLALTADHGVTPAPAYIRDVVGRPAEPLWLDGVTRRVDAALRSRYHADFGLDFDYGLLFANVAALRARAVDVDSLADAAAALARATPGVRTVYTPRSLATAPATDTMAVRWRNSIPADAGWLIAAIPEQDYIWSQSGHANHGTPYLADVRVPIIFVGAGIPARVSDHAVRTVDIAPTLAALLGIRPTEPLDGRPVPELTTGDRAAR